ncbi:aldehyde dehydrogenase family protein [Paucibacter sp. JuS9]|uniref:aldehyde dehydrogenase family protein n=1 Tax=Paucibacter sp. JuS9 TaxID=3228748 RepID=UPI0037580B5A
MEKLPTRNPRSGAVDYQMPVFAPRAVAAEAASLREGQIAWLAAGVDGRVQAMTAWAQAMRKRRSEMLEALAADTGRWSEGEIEFEATLGAVARWCQQAPELLAAGPDKATALPHIRVAQGRVPYALVGVISPWNFPLLLSLIDALPALLAGCAVMVKPSEVTPRFVPVLNAALAEVPLLREALRFVTGPGSTGEALIDQVDLVCFTGSVSTGRRVAEQAARRFIPAQLELGGKDAALVFADADLDLAAKALAWGSMVNAGQSCMSLERCYVERTVFDRFAALLAEHVAGLQLNWPDIRAGAIGPIIAAPQAALIRRHLEDAYAKGARALTGGQVVEHEGGLWCQPTVLVDATHDMQIVRDETFAPILPLIPFDSEAEAVQLANDSAYGLSGAVFTCDEARAMRVARQMKAGAVSINDASLTALIHEGGKQSFGLSGLGGTRMGAKSIERFYRLQAYLINDGRPSPWWFAI